MGQLYFAHTEAMLWLNYWYVDLYKWSWRISWGHIIYEQMIVINYLGNGTVQKVANVGNLFAFAEN